VTGVQTCALPIYPGLERVALPAQPRRSHPSPAPGSMAEKARIVGIDLGTTNLCVASVRNRIPKIVPTDRGNLILPAVVALSEKGESLVGGVAKDQLVTNPRNTVYGAKRLIGRPYESRVRSEEHTS